MAKIVVLGAGIAGHTAAAHLRRKLGKEHEVLVVSPNTNYQWVPSNIWVGVGRMKVEQVIFPLEPLYKRKGIGFKQAKVLTFHPEGNTVEPKQHVEIEYIAGERQGQKELVTYDYLINATGPKLAFEQTEGLTPGQNDVYSVCTYGHAKEAAEGLKRLIENTKTADRKLKILIGTGHARSTCQGAAFEYILNVESELRHRGLRDKVEIKWISNEYELGDLGMGGMLLAYKNVRMRSSELVEMVFEDREITWITGAGVNKVEKGKVHYETLDGEQKTEEYDFAMLIPLFTGHGFKAFDKNGEEITSKLFNGFMIVDADYSVKKYEEWKVQDWPETYQNPSYPNIFAPGIAFAPPHPISKPRTSPSGTSITPSPPRTGMPSGITAKLVADSIINKIKKGEHAPLSRGSLGNMGAACIASAGYGLTKGSGVSITVFPIAPDYEKYPKTDGRDISKTFGDIGLAGHWVKFSLHIGFLWKAKMRPFWWLIPE